VDDVSVGVAFYERALGAEAGSRSQSEDRLRWARVRFDGGSLVLDAPDGASSAARRRSKDPSEVVLYGMCVDALGLREHLDAAGLPVGPRSREGYGTDEFSLRDPDGYVIRFSSPGRTRAARVRA
jgi:uncharacterized glyoxalase superfamily protein PhnB